MILISSLAYPVIIFLTYKFSLQSMLFPGPPGNIVEILIVSTILYSIFAFFLAIITGLSEK